MSGRGYRALRGSSGRASSSVRSQSSKSSSRSSSPSVRGTAGRKPSRGPRTRGGRGSRGIKSIKPEASPPVEEKRPKVLRRPKFSDNPSAPEIVEKKFLKSNLTAPVKEEGEETATNGEEVCDIQATNGHSGESSEMKIPPNISLEDPDDDEERPLFIQEDEDFEERRSTTPSMCLQESSENVVEEENNENPRSLDLKNEDNSEVVVKKRKKNDEDSIDNVFTNKMRKLLINKIGTSKVLSSSSSSNPIICSLKSKLSSIKPLSESDDYMRDEQVLESIKSILSEIFQEENVISNFSDKLLNLIKELLKSHIVEQLPDFEEDSVLNILDKCLTYFRSSLDGSSSEEINVVPLTHLESGMVPVTTVELTEVSSEMLLEKPKIDKSKLFSHMEDKFAKETQKALKNKPVYRKRLISEISPKEEVPEVSENKENNLEFIRKETPSPPTLVPEGEVGESKPVVVVPSSSELNSLRVLRIPIKSTSGDGAPCLALPPPPILERPNQEEPPVLSSELISSQFVKPKSTLLGSALISEFDAETAAAAVASSLSPPPSLKTVIRLPKIKKKKKKLILTEDKPSNISDSEQPPLVIDEKPSSPDSHKSGDEKSVPPESMVVPEKASSFNIHPGRCCSDSCHYCSLKFGTLDTPLHISQMKTLEIRKYVEDSTGYEKDACLCDKCFRYLDRQARNRNSSDKKRNHEADPRREERVQSCIVRNCNREVTNNISKKWIICLKKKLVRKLSLDWDRISKASVKTVFPVCSKHNSLVEFYSLCGLCKQKLNVSSILSLGMNKSEVSELNVLLREDRIPAELVENHFVCKLCKSFCAIKQKSVSSDYFKAHKNNRVFYKEHKKRLYEYLGIESGDPEEPSGGSESSKAPKKIHQVSQSDNPTKITIKTTTLEETPGPRQTRKRRTKEFPSPSPDSRISVTDNSPDASVNISFDLNTKKLWQDLHFPYGNYTAFFRHLILLEKYWRNGDLALSEQANSKASVYVKSVQNRIRAYEGRNKKSDIDLSESTRPDLSVPAAPQSNHDMLIDEDDKDPSYEPGPSNKSGSEELTTPSKNDNNTTGPEILRIPKIPMPESPPTKIRVRSDLCHLGLLPKVPAPNVMTETPPSSSKSVPTKKMSPHTISSMLSGGKSAEPPETLAHHQSSNSQLFKNNDSSSSAIPLTFNNSIAEVLAAAKSQKTKESSSNSTNHPASKPEITITTTKSPHPTARGGTSTSWSSSDKSSSPLVDMTKLLQTQTPSIPPHLMAQNQLSKQTTKGSSSSTITNSRPSTARVSTPPGPNKKSLDNIVDRLVGKKNSTPPKAISTPSSLIQQLQAPSLGGNNSTPHPTAAQHLMWAALNQGGLPSGMIPQYQDWLNSASQQAMIMAGTIPFQNATRELLLRQELLRRQGSTGGNHGKSPTSNATTSNRFRAPPPLTHMGSKTPTPKGGRSNISD